MTKWKHEDWQRLGVAVQDARIDDGLSNIEDWAEAVGRSSKTLYRIEQGRHVSASTLRLVEDALGWDAGRANRILDGMEGPEPVRRPKPDPRQLSNDELLAEVARRMRGGEQGGDTAATSVTVEAVEESEEGNGTVVARTKASRSVSK